MQLDSRLYSLIVLLAVLASVTALLMTRTVEGDSGKALLAIYGMVLTFLAPSPVQQGPAPALPAKSAVLSPESRVAGPQ